MTKRILLAAAAAISVALAGCGREKTCASDQQLCGGTCTAVRQDPLNCGACGAACPAGEACSAGACTDCASACGAGNHCVNGLCVANLYAACFNTNEVRGATADLQPAGLPIATDTGPIALARVGDKMYAANSLSNSVTEIAFGTGAPATRQIGVFSRGAFIDLEYVAAKDGILYVSNASVNTLVAIDPARGVIDELPLAPSPTAFANPQGIDFSGTKAYVVLNGLDRLAVVDVSTVPGCQPPDPNAPACDAACTAPRTCVADRCQRALCARIATTIDLSGLVGAGAKASPWRVKVAGNRAYVTLAHLNSSFAPAGDGKVAVIDTTTDALVPGAEAVDLPGCLNPGALVVDGSTMYVACGHQDFGTGALSGNGLATLSLGAGAPAFVGLTPTPGSAPVSVAACGGRAYLGDRASGTVLRYDPVTGGVSSSAVCPPGEFFTFVPHVECSL